MATSIVDALKAQGHILVVKGGSTPLVRELDERMSSHLDAIVSRIVPRGAVGGEVTSTFGNEAVDEAVEQVVARLTRTLMDSDHVEDVFAEDNVIQRDIFRVVRDALLHREDVEGEDEDEQLIRVRLDTLGYVASTVAKLASAAMLRESLERAASAVEAQLASYSAPTREATFLVEGGGPDRGLELEEAVADELSDLVDAGFVELPTIERRIELDRDTTARERAASRARVELAAVKTIMRSGCAATWEFIGPRTVKLTFTPLSEQDARDVDQYVPQFARELAALFGGAGAAPGGSAARASRSALETADLDEPPPSAPTPSKRMKEPRASSRTAAAASTPPPRAKEPRPSSRTAAAASTPPSRAKEPRPSSRTAAASTPPPRAKEPRASSRTAAAASTPPPRAKQPPRAASKTTAKRGPAKRSSASGETPTRRVKASTAASTTPRTRTSAAPAKKTKTATKKR
jgi:hypothetical protein